MTLMEYDEERNELYNAPVSEGELTEAEAVKKFSNAAPSRINAFIRSLINEFNAISYKYQVKELDIEMYVSGYVEDVCSDLFNSHREEAEEIIEKYKEQL